MRYHDLALPQSVHAHQPLYYSVLHLNTRSALNKEDSIAQFLGQFSFQFKIIMFTETWYRDDCAVLHLDGYKHFFINRPYRRGGGVAVISNLYLISVSVHVTTKYWHLSATKMLFQLCTAPLMEILLPLLLFWKFVKLQFKQF